MYCKHCGHKLNSDNMCTNPECPSKTNINPTQFNYQEQQDSAFNEFRDINGISTSEMVNFIGEKKADYYLEQWDKYQENENFISWNWPAFLCGFYWFWYRKIYSVMAIVLVVSVLGQLLLPEVAANILSLGIMIGSGMFANQLYIKNATKRIISIKSLGERRGLNYDAITRRLRTNGGTTIAPIITVIVITVIIVLALIVLIALGASLSEMNTSSFKYY